MINPSVLDLSALLEKLSKFDPKLCDRRKDGYNVNCYSISGDRWMTVCLYFDNLLELSPKSLAYYSTSGDRWMTVCLCSDNLHELSPKSLAYITSALQQAIAAHDATVEIRGGAAGWTAWISSSNCEVSQKATNSETAIALLSAYVQWLENVKEAKA